MKTFGVSLAYRKFTQMNSSTRVKVYTGDFCPICEIVERYLSEKNVKYVKINVDEDPVGREEFLKLGYENFPVIDIEGTTVLGYNVEAIDKALREKGITH